MSDRDGRHVPGERFADDSEHAQQETGREWATECGDLRWSADDSWKCTRLAGHDGQHEAASLVSVEKVWSR